MAALVLVALIVLAMGATTVPADVADDAEDVVCRIVQLGEGCPPAGPGVEEEPEDELNRDRWSEIPCIVDSESDYRAWDLYLPRFINVAGSASEGIQQVGPDRWRVSITGENRLGVGTFTGDPPGNRDIQPPYAPQSGFHGIGAVTLGGRTSTTYEFASREEAEEYLESRRGGWRQWAAAITGVQGHVVDELWQQGSHWVQRGWNWLTGEDPPPPPPKPRFYTMAINPRAQGSGGYNTGRYGGVGVSGGVTLDEALTLLDDPDQNLWIHSASVDVGAGGTLHLPPLLFGEQRQGRRPPRFPGPWPSPSINGGAAIDVGLRYRYISREGEPVRLVLVYEQTFSRLGGAGAGFRDNPGGDRYRGGGGSVAARTTETVVREAHLDLTIPENREAFQRLFVTLGPTAHPDPAMIARFLTSGADLAEPASDIAALIQRFDEDGAFAQFQYEGSGFEGSLGFANYPGQAGGGRRGMWGVFPSTGESERHLIDAQFMDNRQDNPEYAPLRSCTEPSSGNGITPNTGSNPRPPSGGGPGGQP